MDNESKKHKRAGFMPEYDVVAYKLDPSIKHWDNKKGCSMIQFKSESLIQANCSYGRFKINEHKEKIS
ncbi:MAG: hypothetical protein PV345_04930 [Wolbachia sp.]|nr:hypothetical protein [Wolbachia sp.]